jgi:ABC-2 type transport system permease protein
MKVQRLYAIMRKEFIHVRRDPRSTILALVLPLIMLGLFGWALSLDVNNVPLAVWDRSGTATSRELISAFTASRYFQVLPVYSYGEIQKNIDFGKAVAAMVIPQELGTRATAAVLVIVLIIYIYQMLDSTPSKVSAYLQIILRENLRIIFLHIDAQYGALSI